MKLPRQERLPPVVRPDDQLQAHRARHRVEGGPEAHRLRPVDAVVGQIVVPGRARFGQRLLHQHVLVEEACGARIHEPGRYLRRGRVEHEVPILGDARPVAVVAEENSPSSPPARTPSCRVPGERMLRSTPARSMSTQSANTPSRRTTPSRRNFSTVASSMPAAGGRGALGPPAASGVAGWRLSSIRCSPDIHTAHGAFCSHCSRAGAARSELSTCRSEGKGTAPISTVVTRGAAQSQDNFTLQVGSAESVNPIGTGHPALRIDAQGRRIRRPCRLVRPVPSTACLSASLIPLCTD